MSGEVEQCSVPLAVDDDEAFEGVELPMAFRCRTEQEVAQARKQLSRCSDDLVHQLAELELFERALRLADSTNRSAHAARMRLRQLLAAFDDVCAGVDELRRDQLRAEPALAPCAINEAPLGCRARTRHE